EYARPAYAQHAVAPVPVVFLHFLDRRHLGPSRLPVLPQMARWQAFFRLHLPGPDLVLELVLRRGFDDAAHFRDPDCRPRWWAASASFNTQLQACSLRLDLGQHPALGAFPAERDACNPLSINPRLPDFELKNRLPGLDTKKPPIS